MPAVASATACKAGPRTPTTLPERSMVMAVSPLLREAPAPAREGCHSWACLGCWQVLSGAAKKAAKLEGRQGIGQRIADVAPPGCCHVIRSKARHAGGKAGGGGAHRWCGGLTAAWRHAHSRHPPSRARPAVAAREEGRGGEHDGRTLRVDEPLTPLAAFACCQQSLHP
jgi:hypothetical protein